MFIANFPLKYYTNHNNAIVIYCTHVNNNKLASLLTAYKCCADSFEFTYSKELIQIFLKKCVVCCSHMLVFLDMSFLLHRLGRRMTSQHGRKVSTTLWPSWSTRQCALRTLSSWLSMELMHGRCLMSK